MHLRQLLTPEGFGLLLEAAVRLGFVSASAFALALGQFALALIFAVVALGLFLRFWRLRRKRQPKK